MNINKRKIFTLLLLASVGLMLCPGITFAETVGGCLGEWLINAAIAFIGIILLACFAQIAIPIAIVIGIIWLLFQNIPGC